MWLLRAGLASRCGRSFLMAVLERKMTATNRPLPTALGHALAVTMVALTTALTSGIEAWVGAPSLAILFVLPVALAAAGFGWGPALTAALAGTAAFNFFFVAPRYTFVVEDPANVLALCLLLLVGALVSGVSALSRRRLAASVAAARRADALQDLARRLVAATDRDAVADACAEALAELFQAPAVVLVEEPQGLEIAAMRGQPLLGEADLDAARMARVDGLPVRAGDYLADGARFDMWPATSGGRRAAVIGVGLKALDAGRPEGADALMAAVGGLLGVALDRVALNADLLEARVAVTGERLKTDLLAAVSHDLKTPLATMRLSLESLESSDAALNPLDRAALIEVASAETRRLARLVDDLLDSGRLETGAVQTSAEPEPVCRLVEAAVAQAREALAARRIDRAGLGGVALRVDPALFASALAKVLENAGRYGPAGSTVNIRAGIEGDMGWVEVDDEGPGFGGAVEPLFARFARGVNGDGRPPGLGLGLSIARGFMTAMGGRIEAGDRDDRAGARVRLLAPLS